MKTTNEQLMKHFATILRDRANGRRTPPDARVFSLLSRKQIVEIIKRSHGGSLPKELDITFMENEELFAHIKDDMHVIAYFTDQWTQLPKNTFNSVKTEEQAKPSEKPKSKEVGTVKKPKA